MADAGGTCAYAAGGAVAALGLVPKPEGRPLGGALEGLVRRSIAGEALVELLSIDDHTFGVSVTPLPDGGAVAVAVEIGHAVAAVPGGRAFHDPLTGLPSREHFIERVRAALTRARARDGVTAVAFIDIDGLGRINSMLGYEVGDRLLCDFVTRLGSNVRPSDTIARLGGDKFSLLCEGLTRDADVLVVVGRLHAAMTDAFIVDGREIFLSASIGVATAAAGDAGAGGLMSDAEAAMHRARERGAGEVEVFRDDMRVGGLVRLDMEQALRGAIERDELVLHYQPIVRLADGLVAGVEALVRWERPGVGLVAPGTFIPVAEETGLIRPIGEWVLADAAQQVSRWIDDQVVRLPFVLSVNLSPVQFAHSDLAAVVRRAASIAEPAELRLEITESALLEATALPVLETLHAAGVSVAVDDFGTGYSSLAYLKEFPVDVLKVDRAFVNGIDSDPGARAIAEAIVALAHALGLEASGEGVETARQLAALRAVGCDSAQGFYLSRPVPASELPAALRRDGRTLV